MMSNTRCVGGFDTVGFIPSFGFVTPCQMGGKTLCVTGEDTEIYDTVHAISAYIALSHTTIGMYMTPISLLLSQCRQCSVVSFRIPTGIVGQKE